MNASQFKIAVAVVPLALAYNWLFNWAYFLLYVPYWRGAAERCRDSGSLICDSEIQAISFLCALVLAIQIGRAHV